MPARHYMIAGGVAAAVLIAAAIIPPRTAHGAVPSLKQCFASSDIRNWVAPDPKTLYLRVAVNRYFRVDLARECWPLKMQGSHLITRSFGPDLICSPVDWNLRTSEGPGDIPEPCFIQSITPLSPTDVAALPKNSKP